MQQGSISNTFNAGVLGVPWMFSGLLLSVVALLGMLLASVYFMHREMMEDERTHREEMKTWATEIRILQVHVQDTNAILLREGIKKPGDELKGPTSGSSK